VSRKSTDASFGVDVAELSKPIAKFKSGIRWQEQQIPEPFMEVSDYAASPQSAARSTDDGAGLPLSGSTAAAQAYVQLRITHCPLPHRRSVLSEKVV
jgi:hypothetical protein